MRRNWIFAVLLGSALISAACHQERRADAAATAAPASQQAPKRLALQQLLPAPGVAVIMHLRPAELMATNALRQSWEPVLKTDRLAAFQHATGFDPSHIQELWWAGYALGSLLLVDAAQDGPRIEQAFIASAASDLVRQQDDSGGRLISALVHGQPQALYHREGDFIAIAYGDIGLVKIVRAYAQGRLRAKTALSTRFLAPLRAVDAAAPLRIFLAGPFEHAQGVVGQGFAAGVLSVTPSGPSLRVSVHAHGLWPEEATTLLQQWWLDVLNASESRAVGLGFPTAGPVVSCRPPTSTASNMDLTQCDTQLTYSSRALAQAVHQLTQGSSSALLEEPTSGWRQQLLGPSRGGD